MTDPKLGPDVEHLYGISPETREQMNQHQLVLDIRKRPILYTLDADNNTVPLDAFDLPKDVPETLFPPIERRKVGHDHLSDDRLLSTVFLGSDHAVWGVPQLFETMLFGAPCDEDSIIERYCCWPQAQKGHSIILAALRTDSDPEQELTMQLPPCTTCKEP